MESSLLTVLGVENPAKNPIAFFTGGLIKSITAPLFSVIIESHV